MQSKQITVKLHYARPDKDYAGWNAWMWTLNNGGTSCEFVDCDNDWTATMKVDGYTTTAVSFIIRKGQWLEQELSERKIDVSRILSGTVHCYINSGREMFDVVMGDDVVRSNKLLNAELDYDANCIRVKTSASVDCVEEFQITDLSGQDRQIKVCGMTSVEGQYELSLNVQLELVRLYQYRITFAGHDYPVKATTVYASKRFNKEFTYRGNDLGATWSKEKTCFKVWAPTAEAVSLALYQGGTPGVNDLIDTITMSKGNCGVWSVEVSGNCNGQYYTYLVCVNGNQIEAVDPYARTTGVNGLRGMVLDLSSTNPKDWKNDRNPNKLRSYTDAVLYELHVRDFSIDEDSGISEKHKGKFLGLTEKGTKTSQGITTGLDYLKDLGITHLHLLPIYDYGSVDESHLEVPQFNWGYDPVNYNAPEGSYSTDPFNGSVRVAELKQTIKALHDNGISVVMDVVYNHVSEAGKFCFNQIVPGYFSRFNSDGSYSNGSGCGNDTASERPMVRKFIVDSIVYWAEEYHIDGFRFDLVGLLDTITINALVDAVHQNRPDAIFYGEGWTLNTAVEPGNYMATQLNAPMTPEFAYFSDTVRDLVAGRNGETLGFVSGLKGQEELFARCFTAATSWCPSPTQTVNYASCHDNYTLMDKLTISAGNHSRDTLIQMNKLAAAIYMTAQGIPFIHAGEEFLREKLDVTGKRIENSYNSPDFVNKIRWNQLGESDRAAVIDYYKGLISFRKAHAALRLNTAADVAANVTYRWITNEVVLFEIKGNCDQDASAGIVVIFNATDKKQQINLEAAGVTPGIWDVYVNADKAGVEALNTVTDGIVDIAPISAMVICKR